MSPRPYPEGIDCVWLASDHVGHLGVFITAGMGPIPVAALDSGYLPLEEIEWQLCQLPSIGHAQLLVTVKRPDDFLDLAERGLFVYDWTDIGRTEWAALRAYEPVATPSKPITVNSLPSDLAVLAKAPQLPNLVFAELGAVDIGAYLTCVPCPISK